MLSLGVAPALVQAQASPAQPGANPYDAGAPGVTLRRYSDLLDLPEEPSAIGADGWRESNDAVGELDGHNDALRWEAEHPFEPPVDPLRADDEFPLLTLEMFLAAALRLRPDLVVHSGLGRFEAAQVERRAGIEVLDLQQIWLAAVAAQTRLRAAEEMLEARRVAEELAMRMKRVGNWDREQVLRHQAARSEAEIKRIEARQDAVEAREALAQAAGFWTEESQAYRLPDRLPDLPRDLPELERLEQQSLSSDPTMVSAAARAERARRAMSSQDRRVAVQLAEAVDATLARSVGREEGLRPAVWVAAPRLATTPNAMDVERIAGQREWAAMQESVIERRSAARRAAYTLEHRFARARQAQRRAVIYADLEEEVLVRYNGMLHSTWDLLDAAFERIEAQQDALEQQVAFWQAYAQAVSYLGHAGPRSDEEEVNHEPS